MSNEPLAGKVALVTGSYRNLGPVTAETLAHYGASVIINDLDKPEFRPKADEVLQKIRAHGVQAADIPADLNVNSEARRLCRQALETFGRVDIVVNNAGPFNMDPYVQLKEETWDLIMNVNLKAIYLTTQELAPGMKANGWGRIVNMCAGSAYVRNHNIYTLAKMGVMVLTESLAIELGPEITVNAIAPGQIVESLPDIHEFDPTFGERYAARAPGKRLVSRAQLADVIAHLCLPVFDGMTGMTLRYDYGAEIPKF